jgi:hypothetical protein
MKAISAVALGLAAIVAAPLGAFPAAPGHYIVHFEVREDGKAVYASPDNTIETGQPIAFINGHISYSLGLVVTPDASGNVTIGTDFSSESPQGLVSHHKSTIRAAADGEPKAIPFQHVDPVSGRTISGVVLVTARPV